MRRATTAGVRSRSRLLGFRAWPRAPLSSGTPPIGRTGGCTHPSCGYQIKARCESSRSPYRVPREACHPVWTFASTQGADVSEEQTVLSPDEARERLEQALFEIRRVIAGQGEMLERVFVCLLSEGHLLIEGVPGLAKTLTIKTTAGVLGGTFARVQFTPDLVPSDLVGTLIYRPGEGTFDTELGPVFCNFLLADEINRAPAKVQSALLEVMQERQVTIGHTTYPVPEPFLVMATQNPIESEGTYPLPEAQVDRFMLKILIGYPEHDEELTIVQRQLVEPPDLRQALSLEDLQALQRT